MLNGDNGMHEIPTLDSLGRRQSAILRCSPFVGFLYLNFLSISSESARGIDAADTISPVEIYLINLLTYHDPDIWPSVTEALSLVLQHL